MRKFLLLLLSLLLVALPLAAQEEAAPEDAYIRAAQFSADAETVDVYVNGELAVADFDFPEVSDWIVAEAGSFEIAFVPAGAAVEDAVASGTFEVAAGEWATFAVVGEAARGELVVQALVDTGEVDEGQSQVSFFHAIPEMAAVNVFFDETELVNGLGFPGTFEESDGYVSTAILADTYAIEVRDDAGTVLVDAGEITLGVNRAYFLAVVGINTDVQYVLIVTDVDAVTGVTEAVEEVETGEGPLMARIGHFAVDAGEVDIYLDGELALAGAFFGDLSEYVEVQAGIHEVALVPAGGTLDEAVYTGEIPLIAESLTLVAAIGYVDDGSVTVVTALENNVEPEFGEIRIAFFQAVPSLNLFDLTVSGNTLIQGLAYPDAFEGAGDGYVSVDLVAGEYEFTVSSGSTSLDVGTITTGAGRVYLIVVAGNESAPVYFFFSTEFPE